MEETWRWFGPDDGVRLNEIRQAGARGIVTALHDIPYGEVWPVEAIAARKRLIEEDASLGLRWAVVESLPVHETVKRGDGDVEPYFAAYRQSLRNLAACGVTTVCYNFMPLQDWMRTDLAVRLPGGGLALRFDMHLNVAFDCYMLERPGAEADYSDDVIERARAWFRASTEVDRRALLKVIMAGLPGAFERYDVPGLRTQLARYAGFTADDLRASLQRFLAAVVPTAEALGILLCIHPDDPPRPLFGLPRIVSTEDDLAAIMAMAAPVANGITLCTGSLGAHPSNDLVAIARRFAGRIHFAHLRNVLKDADGSFMESDHLDGDVDMPGVVLELLREEARRRAEGRADAEIPMRPDHGHVLIDDGRRKTHPGYPLIGRLKGLAELRGVMRATGRFGLAPAG